MDVFNPLSQYGQRSAQKNRNIHNLMPTGETPSADWKHQNSNWMDLIWYFVNKKQVFWLFNILRYIFAIFTRTATHRGNRHVIHIIVCILMQIWIDYTSL